MNDAQTPARQPCVLFSGHRLLARGEAAEIAVLAQEHQRSGQPPVSVYLDQTGLRIDLDLSGTKADVVARLSEHPILASGALSTNTSSPRGPGRPKLGVVSREVSLLPRHWQWLGEQPGGASAALRRLVDAERRNNPTAHEARQALEAAHRFLWDVAGDLPGFEAASRALFASDFDGFESSIQSWPAGIVEQVMRYVERARPVEGKASTTHQTEDFAASEVPDV